MELLILRGWHLKKKNGSLMTMQFYQWNNKREERESEIWNLKMIQTFCPKSTKWLECCVTVCQPYAYASEFSLLESKTLYEQIFFLKPLKSLHRSTVKYSERGRILQMIGWIFHHTYADQSDYFFLSFNLLCNWGHSGFKLPTAWAAYGHVVLRLGTFPSIPFTV